MMAAIRVSIYSDAFGLRELIRFKPKDQTIQSIDVYADNPRLREGV